ncbi:MAG: hypothetical protein Q8R82_13985 [Hyphomonadaceae bacterium]|nr:hypothetical protein [Hyphomonadaceae bacterium]
MSAKQYPELDLAASLKKLSEWLSVLRTNGYDFSEDSRRHQGLATKLRSTAALLDGQEWSYLEDRFDDDPPPEVGADGLPIPYPGNNAARYKILLSQLRELAETADRLADENPKPRTKPEIPMAADFFLHLWLAAGNERPTLYGNGPAATALGCALSAAGYVLSNERVRGILAEALNKFDPHFCLDQWRLDRLMVWHQ